MTSSSTVSPIALTICFGSSNTFTLSSTNDVSNRIALSSTILQIKERISSSEELAESCPIECQRLYFYQGHICHFLLDDNRTLNSYGITENNITFHLARSNQRRRTTATTNTSTAAAPTAARTEVPTSTAPPIQHPRTALISYRRADELFDNLQQRMSLLREMQDVQMMRRSQRHRLNTMVNELLEGCSEISDVLAMSPTSCSDHVLDRLHNFSKIPSPDLAQSCVICKVDFSRCNLKRKPIVKTNCHHVYHRECLKKWMIASNNLTCPLCRSRV